jgi:hypothetical protein
MNNVLELQENRIKREQRELENSRIIIDNLPEYGRVPLESVGTWYYDRAAIARYKGDNIADVMDVIGMFSNFLPLFAVPHEGFVSAERYKGRTELDSVNVRPVCPFLVEFDPHVSRAYSCAKVSFDVPFYNTPWRVLTVQIEVPETVFGEVTFRKAIKYVHNVELKVKPGVVLPGYHITRYWSSREWPNNFVLSWNSENVTWPFVLPYSG